MVSFITTASEYIITLPRPKTTRPRATNYQSKLSLADFTLVVESLHALPRKGYKVEHPMNFML